MNVVRLVIILIINWLVNLRVLISYGFRLFAKLGCIYISCFISLSHSWRRLVNYFWWLRIFKWIFIVECYLVGWIVILFLNVIILINVIVISINGIISVGNRVISLIRLELAVPIKIVVVYLRVLVVYIGRACVHLLAAILIPKSIYILSPALL